jgi:hypothetical protein
MSGGGSRGTSEAVRGSRERGWIAYIGRESGVGVLVDEEARRHRQMTATAALVGLTSQQTG